MAAAQAQSPVSLRLATIKENMNVDSGKVKLPWIKDKQGQVIFGLAICANSAFIGVELQAGVEGFNVVYWLVESLFLVAFIIEICLRLRAEKPKYWNYFDAWGFFDIVVTTLGCIDVWVFLFLAEQDNPLEPIAVVRMFRMLRLVRLLRVFRMFENLVVVLFTLANSVKAVGWMTMLLSLMVYTSSILTVVLIGKPNKDNPEVHEIFGNLGSAFFAHFQVVTLEGWPGVAQTAMQANRLWGVYFMCMIIVMNFALANLMVGVIVERIIRCSVQQQHEDATFTAESEQFRTTLEALFIAADFDSSGEVTRAEVRQLMQDKRTKDILNAFGITVNIPADALHTIMGLHDDGPTNFDEFFDACMRMCGSKNNSNSLFLQQNVCDFKQETSRRLSALASDLQHFEQLAQLSRPQTDVLATPLPAEEEIAVRNLLSRMDRFGQIQLEMSAEIRAIKAAAGLLAKDSKPGCERNNSYPFGGPIVLDKLGHEVHHCCASSILNLRQAACNPDLRAAARKELEAEFRTKHAAGR